VRFLDSFDGYNRHRQHCWLMAADYEAASFDTSAGVYIHAAPARKPAGLNPWREAISATN
jgi:hypothetical protein